MLVPVEVVYATCDQQIVIELSVPAGTGARQVVRLSALADRVPALDIERAPLGIYGKVLADDRQVIESGDRVEVYRPLLADPKEVRKRRAERARAQAERQG